MRSALFMLRQGILDAERVPSLTSAISTAPDAPLVGSSVMLVPQTSTPGEQTQVDVYSP